MSMQHVPPGVCDRRLYSKSSRSRFDSSASTCRYFWHDRSVILEGRSLLWAVLPTEKSLLASSPT
jgi:hypothetical protein